MHPPHEYHMLNGEEIHKDDCARCIEIGERANPYLQVIPLAEFQRIDAQLDAEDAQEAAKETK